MKRRKAKAHLTVDFGEGREGQQKRFLYVYKQQKGTLGKMQTKQVSCEVY